MSKEIEILKKKADKLWKEKNWDEYTSVVTELIKYQEAHDEAGSRRNLGYAYIMENDFGRAFEEFNIAVRRDPSVKFLNPLAYIASRISAINNLGKEQQSEAFEMYYKLLFVVYKIKVISFYKKEVHVAHYTSLHTLKNLSEPKSCFRFYNADYVNDPEEGSVFFNIMNEEYQTDIETWFYKDKDKSDRSPAYIGSFVIVEEENKHKDKLFLWRTYGKHDNEEAAGACLIFNNERCFAKYSTPRFGPMEEHSNLLQENLTLYKIHYRGQPNEKLEENLKELGGQLKDINKFIKKTDLEKIKDELALRKLVCELVDSVRFLFKESHYYEENEVRVIQWRYGETNESSESQIKVDAENMPPRFYLEAPENFRWDEVILGPRTERYQEWEQWLNAKVKEQNRSIDIKQSGIKYGKS